MLFALTNYGATLFSTTGIPNSLNFVAGDGYGYSAQASDTSIHGSITMSGTATLLGVSGEPSYSVLMVLPSGQSSATFGEIGLFFNGVMVALGASTTASVITNNVSVTCNIPAQAGALAPFSPVVLSSTAGNLNTLPSVDVLPNASTSTTYTQSTGVSNAYLISGTGIIAVSEGSVWQMSGAFSMGQLPVDDADFTNIYIKVTDAASLVLPALDNITCYVSVITGVVASNPNRYLKR